jgi:two-component system phosphate regulon response regulator PhoB
MPQRRILIVDDEPYIVSVLAMKFRGQGDEVRTASDGEEAYEAIAAWLPDLVISDFQMPVLSGFEMAVRLKANPKTAAIPLIMLTARGHRLEEAELAKTNIRCLLAKPFSARELAAEANKLAAPTSGAKDVKDRVA